MPSCRMIIEAAARAPPRERFGLLCNVVLTRSNGAVRVVATRYAVHAEAARSQVSRVIGLSAATRKVVSVSERSRAVAMVHGDPRSILILPCLQNRPYTTPPALSSAPGGSASRVGPRRSQHQQSHLKCYQQLLL